MSEQTCAIVVEETGELQKETRQFLWMRRDGVASHSTDTVLFLIIVWPLPLLSLVSYHHFDLLNLFSPVSPHLSPFIRIPLLFLTQMFCSFSYSGLPCHPSFIFPSLSCSFLPLTLTQQCLPFIHTNLAISPLTTALPSLVPNSPHYLKPHTRLTHFIPASFAKYPTALTLTYPQEHLQLQPPLIFFSRIFSP